MSGRILYRAGKSQPPSGHSGTMLYSGLYWLVVPNTGGFWVRGCLQQYRPQHQQIFALYHHFIVMATLMGNHFLNQSSD
ncbi:hypothetical protein F5Y01DRAFT_283899 [Xylaria sp. FL0043]|nr:hypothetical protein F5Y01DRAFT_283899 [Xylaria sp. FL0043]